MNINFKHSLRGYDPVSVERIIDSLKLEFEKTLRDLKKDLSGINQETQLLHEKYESMKMQILTKRDMEEEISKTLFEAHMSSSKKVFEALNEAEKAEKEKLETVKSNKRKNMQLQKALNEIVMEMQSIIEN